MSGYPEIAARVEAATPGPWKANTRIGVVTNAAGDPLAVFGGQQDRADAEFTAHARNDIPALLAEVNHLRNQQALDDSEYEKATAELATAQARIAELENALAATGRSLSSFIFDSDDPGADALGAQWLYHQAMPQADDPFAQPRAYRSSVFSEASKAVEGMDGRPSDGEHSQEYLNGYSHALEDAAECLEKIADQAAEGTEVSS